MKHAWRFFAPVALLLALAPNAKADTFYPMLMGIDPVAVQVGRTSQCRIHSRYTMHDAVQVVVSGRGVKAELVPHKLNPKAKKTPNIQWLDVKFTVAPDAPLGVREVRVLTPRGLSTVGQLVVVRQPVVAEKGNNNTLAQAQQVTLPAAICGRLERGEDVDMFRFHAKAGQRLVFHVRCQRLQDKIHDLQQHADPILTLRTAKGQTLATSDNVLLADPVLAYTFRQEGDYVLELRDVRYQGRGYWYYVIEVWRGPFAFTTYPPAVQQGAKASLHLVGPHVPEEPLAWNVPQELVPGVHQVQLPQGQGTTNPLPLYVSSRPVQLEADQPNEAPEQAQQISVPGGISGRMNQPGDVDYFRFQAKKGQAFRFEVFARRLQSALDPHIRILNADGKRQLALNDDFRHYGVLIGDSLIDRWVAPADGMYLLEVRDVHLRGGPEFVYHVDVAPAEPYFVLSMDAAKTILAPGTCAPLFVRAERRNGFQGEVELEVEGVPPGIKTHIGRILADRTDGVIFFEAPQDAKVQLARIRVFGKAKVKGADGKEHLLRVEAVPRQETYMPGGGRSHWPVEEHYLSVTSPQMDIQAVELNTYDVKLRPGESKRIEVTIKRAKDFKKNVTLAVVFFHLSSRYGDVLPRGVTLEGGKSKTLLKAGEDKGWITLKAAPGAKPVQGVLVPVMAHVSINFVMKSTYAARPLRVTILPAEKK